MNCLNVLMLGKPPTVGGFSHLDQWTVQRLAGWYQEKKRGSSAFEGAVSIQIIQMNPKDALHLYIISIIVYHCLYTIPSPKLTVNFPLKIGAWETILSSWLFGLFSGANR